MRCLWLQGHYDRVVRRMRLTQQQVRHFAAVLEEIGRLDDAVMAQGGQLARNAACPSTVVLAAEAERGAAAAAAAAAGAAARSGRGTDLNSSSTSSSSGDMLGKIARADAEASEQSSDGRAAAAAAPAATGVRSARGPSAAAAAAAASAGDISGPADTPAAADDAAAAAADAEADDNALAPPGAESLLQRNVGRLPLHAMLLLVFNCNTLTRVQLAKW
jgi:hypothetical protein